VRLARCRRPGAHGAFLVRLEDDGSAVLLAEESDHVSADVLRESLAAGVDLGGPGSGRLDASELELLTPVRHPGRILCAALNYRAHAAETGREPPSAPMFFSKFSHSLVDPDRDVHVPDAELTDLDYEGEVAVVLGARCTQVSEADAASRILGYTIANDVSARAQQRGDGQWWRAKGSDGFCPLGPWIVTGDGLGDPQALELRTSVNGELRQQGSTSDLIFSVPALIAHLSRFITLEAGDVLLTGTPPGVGVAMSPPRFLSSGDVVEVSVEGIGVLSNTIRVP
jgi:2-keto-4-pentenoate hydratase/2-oxohepta-3-ene-1,7-dioic acid hydratase in catechol pathway